MGSSRPDDALDYVRANREQWNEWAAEFVPDGERNWGTEACWGIWSLPESEVGLLPDVSGLDVLEAGCGTGYVSAWMARRGGRPVGIDNSPAQLATARRLQREHGLEFPLLHAIAEELPFPDASFDYVISEYGAAIWSDPYRWIPEAARVLRPGGELMFLKNSSLLMLCMPDEGAADPTLKRDHFGMLRFEWPDSISAEFHLGHGDQIRLLRRCGLEVLDLIELRPPAGAKTRYDFVQSEWARRWPSEEVWRARKPE